MAAIALADCTVAEINPNSGLKRVVIVTPATADPGDTVAIVLASYGITTLLSVSSWVQTTVGSVVTTVANTTAVSSGTLTVTFVSGDGNTDKVRVIEVTGSN